MILQRLRGGNGSAVLWRKIGAATTTPIQIVDGRGHPLPHRFSREWWRGLIRQAGGSWRRTLLPADYPTSVHPYYTPFTLWNFLQLSLGSAAGVLATQSVLYGLGLTSAGSGLALSATLNWIIKDGLGQIGGIVLMAYLGNRFDVQTKRYRFLAALLLKIASILECLVPLAPRYFILTASLANVLKNVCWMTASATRAQIHRHLTFRDNLGDVTGRTAAQNTLASLLGTGLGALLSTLYVTATTIPGSTPIMAVGRCLSIVVPLSLLSLFAAYRSCLYVLSPRLTISRLTSLTETLFAEIIGADKQVRDLSQLGSLSRYVHDPEFICRREPFLWKDGQHHHLIPLHIEPLIVSEQTVRTAWTAHSSAFWISLEVGEATTPQSNISIWFNEQRENDEIVFKGLLVALLLRHSLSRKIAMTPAEASELIEGLYVQIREAFVSRGWHIRGVDIGPRHPVRLTHQHHNIANGSDSNL